MHITSLANFVTQQNQSGDSTDPAEMEQNGAFASFINDLLITPVTENGESGAQETFVGLSSTGANSEVLDEDGAVSEQILQFKNIESTLSSSKQITTTLGELPDSTSENFGNTKDSTFIENFGITTNTKLNAQGVELPKELLQNPVNPTAENPIKIEITNPESVEPGELKTNSSNPASFDEITTISNPNNSQKPVTEIASLTAKNPRIEPALTDSDTTAKTPKAIQNITRGEAKTFTGTDADIARELGFRNVSDQEKALGTTKGAARFSINLGNDSKAPHAKKLPGLIRSVSQTILESESVDHLDIDNLDLEGDSQGDDTTSFEEIPTEKSSLLSKLESDLARKEAKIKSQKATIKPNAVSKTSEASNPQTESQTTKFDIAQRTSKFSVKLNTIADQIKTPLLELTSLANKDGTPKTMRFKLNPEELGHIEIRLEKTSSGKLDIQFTAENEGARELLAESFEQLKNAIKNAGWQVEQLEVSSGSLSSDDLENGQKQNDQNKSFGNSTNKQGDLDNTLNDEEASNKIDSNRLVNLRA